MVLYFFIYFFVFIICKCFNNNRFYGEVVYYGNVVGGF